MKICPNCNGWLIQDNDRYEDYLVCIVCAREFNLGMRSRRMTPEELYSRCGVKLTMGKESANMRLG